jgi:hypothetical protein
MRSASTYIGCIFDICSRGRAAIPPQGDLIATTNLMDGVGWYCIREKRLVGTTRYSIGAARVSHPLDITFRDNSTIVAGHNRGQVVIASCGMWSDSDQIYVGGGSRCEVIHRSLLLILSLIIYGGTSDATCGLSISCKMEPIMS